MVHQYQLNGYNIVLDTCSGAIHVVDEVAYDIIALYPDRTADEIVSAMMEKYGEREDVTEQNLRDCIADVEALKKAGKLYTPDTFADMAGTFKERSGDVVKALCLHVSHDCNLRCSYCDTAYAWDASQAKEWLSEDNLFQQITAYPWKRVTLTGGEPMLQPIETLCRRLGDAGYEVNIETNGAAALFLERPDRLFYTMDIKSPSSGEKDRMRWENLSLLTADDVLKFVVGSVEDLRYMETILSTYSIKAQIYVSPVFGKIEPVALVDFVKHHQLSRVCVQVQLHKVIWDPEARGV